MQFPLIGPTKKAPRPGRKPDLGALAVTWENRTQLPTSSGPAIRRRKVKPEGKSAARLHAVIVIRGENRRKGQFGKSWLLGPVRDQSSSNRRVGNSGSAPCSAFIPSERNETYRLPDVACRFFKSATIRLRSLSNLAARARRTARISSLIGSTATLLSQQFFGRTDDRRRETRVTARLFD